MILLYTLAFASIGSWWLGWWCIPAAAALVAFWRLRPLWRAMPQAFIAGGLAWALPALWRDAENGSLLATKMAALFHLPGAWGMLAMTSCVGGLLAVFGAIIGQRLRKLYLLWRTP